MFASNLLTCYLCISGASRPNNFKISSFALKNLQMKQMMIKFQSFIEDCNLEGLATALSELESLEDLQEEYMVQLETEQMLLINKIKELGQEFLSSSPSLSRRSSGY